MRPIGGELEMNTHNFTEYFTDSGRSSIRLLIKQPFFKNKKILLPNFLCDVIIDVLVEEKISYDFYNIDETFSINEETLKKLDFDVLYVIHYFGNITKIKADISDKILIEDYVFNQNFENKMNHPRWYAFNSFRKILPVTDGSLIKTNLSISDAFIMNSHGDFVKDKMDGKKLKYNYIHQGKGKEQDYLQAFEKGEKLLDSQKNIHKISTTSLSYLTTQEHHQKLRKERFHILEQMFSNKLILFPKYYSFFILKIENRDEKRKKLMQENIFLPIHWKSKYINNSLSEKVLSIPLFENITTEEFEHLITKLKQILS